MPIDVAVSDEPEEPPSGSDFFIRHPRHRRRITKRRSLDPHTRCLVLAVVLLGAAISAPLAFIRCTGGLSLDLLYTWPAVLAFSAPAVVLLREMREMEPAPSLVARLPLRARDGARSRRRGRNSTRSAARSSGMRRDTDDRPA